MVIELSSIASWYLMCWACMYLLAETILISDEDNDTYSKWVWEDVIKDFFNLTIGEVLANLVKIVIFPILAIGLVYLWIKKK